VFLISVSKTRWGTPLSKTRGSAQTTEQTGPIQHGFKNLRELKIAILTAFLGLLSAAH
jgi:hypothetical protein